MSNSALFISVRLLDGRYHGSGVWPPSPFRLFQALVAAAHAGRNISSDEMLAFRWLEALEPPIIVSPKARQSHVTQYYVPRNGADTDGGDLAKSAKKRDAKLYCPWLFDETVPFAYIWSFDCSDEVHAQSIASISERLYQLGRGIDMAFAFAECMDTVEAEQRISAHGGVVHRPMPKGASYALACPSKHASFKSLLKRHQAQLGRLKNDEFNQVPPSLYEALGYDSPTNKFLFDIVENSTTIVFAAQDLTDVVKLVENLREQAALRLDAHWPKADVECYIRGRNAVEADKALRIRIIPLPSIGLAYSDQNIRRILVEAPPDCPIARDDIAWAFSGLNLGLAPETRESLDTSGPMLIKSHNRKMLRHYGVETDTRVRVWQTVTPVALNIDRQMGEISGNDRAYNEQRVAHLATQALRHAGLNPKAEIRKVQREPFDWKGACANEFAYGRFPANQLFHLEIAFDEPVSGPILLGNGRYLGLGLMQPKAELNNDVLVLEISANHRPQIANRALFLQSVRRALLACARDCQGAPGRLFSGHEADGAPARSGQHDHVFLAADDSDGDGLLDHLLIVAPWRADRTHQAGQEALTEFSDVTSKLEVIRSGRLGVFQLAKSAKMAVADRWLKISTCWRSATIYAPTRYPKSMVEAEQKIQIDIQVECQRRGLPQPQVEIISLTAGWRGGIRAEARLTFAVAVSGPLMLGRESHKGGGLFYVENG